MMLRPKLVPSLFLSLTQSQVDFHISECRERHANGHDGDADRVITCETPLPRCTPQNTHQPNHGNDEKHSLCGYDRSVFHMIIQCNLPVQTYGCQSHKRTTRQGRSENVRDNCTPTRKTGETTVHFCEKICHVTWLDDCSNTEICQY